MIRLAASLLGILVAGAAVSAADPDPKSLIVPESDISEARELVRKLGSAIYKEREDATRALREMGRRALSVLETGIDDPDSEIRLRCEILLPAAEADDFEARLATFLADRDGKFEHELPGWKEFQTVAGSGSESRNLFTEMLQSPNNRELISGMAIDKAELARRLDARKVELYAKMYPRTPINGKFERYEPTLQDAVLFLFLETVLGDKNANPRLGPVSVYTLVNRPRVKNELGTSKSAPTIRKLIVAWAESRSTPYSLQQAMNLIGQLKLKEGMGAAAKLIKLEGATPHQRLAAATAIARTGSAENVTLLKPLFEDKTVFRFKVGAVGEIRVQDAGLAMAIVLTNQDPKDYGFKQQNVGLPPGDAKFYPYSQWFASEEDRKAAFEKFAEWESKQKPTEKK